MFGQFGQSFSPSCSFSNKLSLSGFTYVALYPDTYLLYFEYGMMLMIEEEIKPKLK